MVVMATQREKCKKVCSRCRQCNAGESFANAARERDGQTHENSSGVVKDGSQNWLEMELEQQLAYLMNLCQPKFSNSFCSTNDGHLSEHGDPSAINCFSAVNNEEEVVHKTVKDERPKSFLREEIDEFDRVFAALSVPSSSSLVSVPELDVSLEISTDDDNMRRLFGKKSSSKPSTPVHTPRHKAEINSSRTELETRDKYDLVDGCAMPNSSIQSTISEKSGDISSPLSPLKPWSEDDRLFEQLLDDLDNIGGVNNLSARRRKKARAIFSEWLFSQDAFDTSEQRASSENNKKEEIKNRRKSAHVLSSIRNRQEFLAERRPRSCDLSLEIICSSSTVWFFKRTPSRHHFFAYPIGTDVPVVSTVVEDDADSGYHTAENTLVTPTAKSPGEWTLTREDLMRRIDAFNLNSHGLLMSIDQGSNTFQGFIRVYMNLIRPINMSLSARPPSIYEVLSHEAPTPADRDSQLASFYLPKDTTKVIHILSDTTVYEVIRCLLTKFRITDNPRKFALYERTLSSDGKFTMRRMMDDEMPLPLCLDWTAQGLSHHKFILQENDAGEIHWDAFSVPELERFLTILNKEEGEYVEQVKAKYQLIRVHIDRRLGLLDKQRLDADKCGKQGSSG